MKKIIEQINTNPLLTGAHVAPIDNIIIIYSIQNKQRCFILVEQTENYFKVSCNLTDLVFFGSENEVEKHIIKTLNFVNK